MKATDNLIIYQKDGKVFRRRQRIDNLDRSKMSPARQMTLTRFAEAARLMKNTHHGLVQTAEGQILTSPAAAVKALASTPISPEVEHRSKLAENRAILRKMEADSGVVAVTFMDELVALIRG